jgi:hypothetical protein
MTAHAWGGVELRQQHQMWTTVEAVTAIAESPELHVSVGPAQSFSLMSPLRLGEAHVEEKPAESSWRGRSAASYVLQPRLSCLRARKSPLVLEVASAWLTLGRMEWRNDGRNDQR